MNYKTKLLASLLCLVLLRLTAFAALSQDDPGKSKEGAAPKTEDKKKPPADSHISVVFKISVEGKTAIPSGSTIELNGDEESCKKLTLNKHLEPDGVTISGLPVCKIKLKIFITGLESKIVSVDLGKSKDTVQIFVKDKGAPVVSP